MEQRSKICVQAWKPVKLTKRAENIRSVAAFFLPKMFYQLYSLWQIGQGSFALAVSLGTVFPPLFGLPPFRGKNGGRLKNLPRVFIMKNSNHVQEHTAIYSLTAYNQRLRQLQRQKRLKILFDCMGYFCICFITFSLLFLGE